jgi:anti-sigma factor RsiW
LRCDDVHPLLTAYLDGELDAQDGSAVRGHLRECADCRQVASDGALRDGLRALPSVDPPASLWHGVRAQLADAEVRDAQRPAWRRALARWTPEVRQVAPITGVLAAAALALVVWRTNRGGEDISIQPPPVKNTHVTAAKPPMPPAPAPDNGDVTADLARDATRRTASYQEAADRLMAQVDVARTTWPADKKRELDTSLDEIRQAVAAAPAGRDRDKALRKQIRFLENALTREEVALR